MSLEPFDASTRVCLAVVALGTPQRLRDCLESLATHESRHAFSVVVVVNPALGADTALEFPVPPDVLVVRPPLNLGWPGGLHYARQRTDAEYLVWVQEDMAVLPGWLDALVDAADTTPDVAAFGSFALDTEGEPDGVNGGMAEPARDVRRWNDTDTSAVRRPVELQRLDWVTSKGLLTRTSAWDEVGGPDPSFFPLNHVDKDYSTHLRAHGHGIALVPTARLRHLQSQSAPSMFRVFVSDHREPGFNATYGPIVEALTAGATTVDHDCKPWFPGSSQKDDPDAAVAAVVARESTTMLIAFAKWASRYTAQQVQHQAEVDINLIESGRREVAATYENTLSWRVTKPIRAIRRRLG